jgi:hypothetical protein
MLERTCLPRLAALASIAAFCAGCSGLTDPEAAAWRPIEAETAPGPRWGHVLVHDPARDRMIVFGGNGPGGKLADTWAFSLETERWTELVTSAGPSARLTPAAILDAPRDRLIVVGGDVGTSFASDETWALDLATLTWSELPPVPIPRFDVIATNDDRRAWFYGGFSAQYAELDDLWELDLETDAWSARTDTGPRPAARSNGGITKVGERVVITMGHDSVDITGDTWEYWLSSFHWYQLAPASEPVVGSHHGYATDAACDTLFLVGGDDNDHYDVGTTSALVLRGTPRFELLPSANLLPPRRHTAAAIDPERRMLFVFGGWQGFGETLGDTWVHPLGGCL